MCHRLQLRLCFIQRRFQRFLWFMKLTRYRMNRMNLRAATNQCKTTKCKGVTGPRTLFCPPRRAGRTTRSWWTTRLWRSAIWNAGRNAIWNVGRNAGRSRKSQTTSENATGRTGNGAIPSDLVPSDLVPSELDLHVDAREGGE